MLKLTLNPDDTLETVLPMLEKAMASGEICRIRPADYLGCLGLSALILLTMADGLLDPASGKVVHPHPGFGLSCSSA